MARSEVRRLEGLGRLVMGFDVQVGFLRISPLNTVVSWNEIWFSAISAVNLIVGWKKLARLMNHVFLLCFNP